MEQNSTTSTPTTTNSTAVIEMNLNENNLLGRGSYGAVYKTELNINGEPRTVQ